MLWSTTDPIVSHCMPCRMCNQPAICGVSQATSAAPPEETMPLIACVADTNCGQLDSVWSHDHRDVSAAWPTFSDCITHGLLLRRWTCWERNPGSRHRRLVSPPAQCCSSRDWGGGLGAGGGGDRGQDRLVRSTTLLFLAGVWDSAKPQSSCR